MNTNLFSAEIPIQNGVSLGEMDDGLTLCDADSTMARSLPGSDLRRLIR